MLKYFLKKALAVHRRNKNFFEVKAPRKALTWGNQLSEDFSASKETPTMKTTTHLAF